jgi:hypothetical protein
LEQFGTLQRKVKCWVIAFCPNSSIDAAAACIAAPVFRKYMDVFLLCEEMLGLNVAGQDEVLMRSKA